MRDDVDGDSFCSCFFGGNVEFYDAGTGVNGFVLVEDEIADAVIDGTTTVFLYGLQCVGMVTNECIGTCVDQLVCFLSLSDSRGCLMFPSPM